MSKIYGYSTLGNSIGRVGIEAIQNLQQGNDPVYYQENGYHADGQLAVELIQYAGEEYRIEYEYTPYKKIEKMTYPSSGSEKTEVQYFYATDTDELKRVKVKTVNGTYVDFIVNLEHDPDGNWTSVQFDGDIVVNYEYNLSGLVTAIKEPNDNYTPINLGFQHDANGNITQIAQYTEPDFANLEWQEDFLYDNLNRLTQAESTGRYGQLDYGYDSVGLGNRTTKTVDGVSYDYNYPGGTSFDSNRLQSITESGVAKLEFAYDNAGRVTSITNHDSGSVLNISYNLQGNISEVRDASDTVIATYAYDTKNRRIRKWIQGVGQEADKDIHYVYDKNGHLIAEYGLVDKSGTYSWDVTREYFWAEGRLIGLFDYDYSSSDVFDMALNQPGKPVAYQVAALSLLAIPGIFLIFGIRRKSQSGTVAFVTFGALFVSSFLIANSIPMCCPDPMVAMDPYFVITGHLGQPLKVVDDLYNTKWQTWYTPFGNTYGTQEDGVTLNMRLPGQYYDAEISEYLGAEIYYNWHRYYMPGVGRYLQLDPIVQGLNGNLSNFHYAENNPITKIDIKGLSALGDDYKGTPYKEKIDKALAELEAAGSQSPCPNNCAGRLEIRIVSYLPREGRGMTGTNSCTIYLHGQKNSSNTDAQWKCTILHELCHAYGNNMDECKAYTHQRECEKAAGMQSPISQGFVDSKCGKNGNGEGGEGSSCGD